MYSNRYFKLLSEKENIEIHTLIPITYSECVNMNMLWVEHECIEISARTRETWINPPDDIKEDHLA